MIQRFTSSHDVSLSEEDADYGPAGSDHDNDVESNVSDNDVKSQDADSADSADTYVSRGLRPWTQDEQRWETASAPSRWNPSPSASRARRSTAVAATSEQV